MNDMSSVIVPKSDQINADDLIAGPMTITIREVQIRGGQEQPVSIYFEGSDKAFRPCKSMSRVLVQGWGADANKYVGRSLTLYRDPTVKWAGLEVGGIRISHMSHIESEKLMMLTATKGSRKPHKVMPLVIEQKPANPNAAEKWANDHIGFIAGAADLDRLAAVQASGKKAMDKLAGTNPDLHAKVVAAYATRLDELSAADDGDPFADTPDWPARATELVALIATDPDAAEKQYRAVMADMPREQANQVEAALAEKRREMGGE